MVFVPLLAFGSESGHHEKGSFWDIRYYWVNFLIYVGGLYFILRNTVKSGWESRGSSIEAAVNKGKYDLQIAEADLREAQAKLASVDREIQTIREEIRRSTKLECDEIVADANARAARILAQGKASATAEQKALENELRRELADLVLQRATERIQREINSETDAPLRSAALSSLQGLIN